MTKQALGLLAHIVAQFVEKQYMCIFLLLHPVQHKGSLQALNCIVAPKSQTRCICD